MSITSDSIVGVTVVPIDLTLTLPTTRKDGSALAPREIQSATILRDSGKGPVELKVLPGPFNGATASYTDTAPASGIDIYTFYVTDTAGTKSAVSVPVMVTVSGAKVLAAPAASTMTAVAQAQKAPVADDNKYQSPTSFSGFSQTQTADDAKHTHLDLTTPNTGSTTYVTGSGADKGR